MADDNGPMGIDMFSRAQFIADQLYRYCILPNGGVRLRETGTICPANTLKSVKARAAFGWAGKIKHKQKFFTKAACRLAISRLVLMPNVEPPSVHGLPREVWEEQQSRVVLHLCQRSRKNFGSGLRFRGYHQSKMDDVQTFPMEVGLFGGSIFKKTSELLMGSSFCFFDGAFYVFLLVSSDI